MDQNQLRLSQKMTAMPPTANTDRERRSTAQAIGGGLNFPFGFPQAAASAPNLAAALPGEIFDSYASSGYQRQRQMTLGDLLLENRIVFLQGEIHAGNANEMVMKLLYLQSENRRKDIHFYINSPGGDVIATLAIYDVMQIVTCPLSTYCVGQAASGAAVLLAGGTKGKRYALPNSRVMIHQPYGGVGGQVSDIEIQADEILRNRGILNDILAKHTGQSVEKIHKDINRDFFLSASQAKEYGVVDEITTRPEVNADDDED